MPMFIGRKIKMTQIFQDEAVVPVSVVELSEKDDLSVLKPGIFVSVSGVSKGKGFQGVVKRHGFSGGPKSHGQKDRLRAPGSIGNTALQRVRLGRKMAGRMGGARVTVKNLKVIEVNSDKKQILLKGAVPGNNRGKLVLKFADKAGA